MEGNCTPIVMLVEKQGNQYIIPQNTTSLCDTLMILKEEEHIFIFLIGIILGIVFVSCVFLFIRLLKKQKGKEIEN